MGLLICFDQESNMPTCRYFSFDKIRDQENQPGLEGKIATHHMKLYRLVSTMETPIVVEFGVDKGRSTCVFLQACEEKQGHLYSVDIADCSNVAESPVWSFIQQSDLETDHILSQAPAIKTGINLLHIDSLHTRDHVYMLLMKWYPHVKAGGYITFHDVDPTPYLRGQRKDNPRHEQEAVGMADVIREFFYANEDQLFLEYHFGSTGMGIMRKLSPLGSPPHPPISLHYRRLMVSGAGLYWTTRHGVVARLKRAR
jgi:predicted O-methyltransferase YrrM